MAVGISDGQKVFHVSSRFLAVGLFGSGFGLAVNDEGRALRQRPRE